MSTYEYLNMDKAPLNMCLSLQFTSAPRWSDSISAVHHSMKAAFISITNIYSVEQNWTCDQMTNFLLFLVAETEKT